MEVADIAEESGRAAAVHALPDSCVRLDVSGDSGGGEYRLHANVALKFFDAPQLVC